MAAEATNPDRLDPCAQWTSTFQMDKLRSKVKKENYQIQKSACVNSPSDVATVGILEAIANSVQQLFNSKVKYLVLGG